MIEQCIFIKGDKKDLWKALSLLEQNSIIVDSVKIGNRARKQAPETRVDRLAEEYEEAEKEEQVQALEIQEEPRTDENVTCQ